jgi:hypothetical protein
MQPGKAHRDLGFGPFANDDSQMAMIYNLIYLVRNRASVRRERVG